MAWEYPDTAGYGQPYYRPRSMRQPNAQGFIAPNAEGLQDTWGDVLTNFNARNRQQAPTWGAAPVAPAYDAGNPFTTISNVKNPSISAAAQSLLNQISSLSTDPNSQHDTTIRSIKSPELQQRVGAEFQNFDTDRAGNRASLADFTSSYLAADPQVKAQTDQEIGSVGEFYNGGVRGNLDKLAADRSLAVTGAAGKGLAAAQRSNRLGQLIRGGSDSYLNAGYADKAGDIYTKAALDNAEQMKQNYLYERAGQTNNVGVRGRLLNDYLMRQTVPTQVGQQVNATDLARLGTVGAMDANNSFYRVTNPQSELAAKLGLVSGVSDLDLRNTFYGVRKPYEPNTQGFIGNPGGDGGGFSFSPAADAVLRSPGGPSFTSGARLPQPIPGSVPANEWGNLPVDIQSQISGQGYDWGAGSVASQSGLPGTSFVQNGQTFVRNADGSVAPVGRDGLTEAQRYYGGGQNYGVNEGATAVVGGGYTNIPRSGIRDGGWGY